MMNGIMGGGMWGMSLFGLLFLIIFVLAIIALLKYAFSRR